jgi:hypothetical protein
MTVPVLRACRLTLVSVTLMLAATACATDSTTEDGTQDANVAGTWKGSILLTAAGENQSYPQIFVLNQSGATVTGMANFDPPDPNDAGTLTGTVAGSRLTFHITYASTPGVDDCGNYPVNGTATIDGGMMTITGGSATDCQGDGHGGHTRLTSYTFAGGTLTRQ